MGKTNRYQPQNGEFKNLRGNKKRRNKKQRATKVNLRKEINFATHRENFAEFDVSKVIFNLDEE